MKLSEALNLVRSNTERGTAEFRIHLAVGFTPFSLVTFVTAYAARALTDRRIECSSGTYGDIINALDAREASSANVILLALEWADIDPRLGLRRLSGWGSAALTDILDTTESRLSRLFLSIARHSAMIPVVVSLPTLPIPCAFQTPLWQASVAEMSLRRRVAEFGERCASCPGVSIVSQQATTLSSPLGQRHSLDGELAGDLPYQTPHAAVVASLLVQSAVPRTPFKGLITDLDDTFWRGLVGEIGPDDVSWDLEHDSQIHGIYQQVLASLAEQGVLLAVVSKNDAGVAGKALKRDDLLVPFEKLFPIEIGWGPKSEAVNRILQAWNVAAGSVVFVDDSPLEVAEVQQRFPEVVGLQFPASDNGAALALAGKLRDLFGKAAISEEDRLRAASIRTSAQISEALGSVAEISETFLEGLSSEIVADFRIDENDNRLFDLINKTNQFNLNGRRIDLAEWRRKLADPDQIVLTLSYNDKFGPLGKISAVLGRLEHHGLCISHWVLSCRAFGRRIEHATLVILMDALDVDRLILHFEKTPKNKLVDDLFISLGVRIENNHIIADRATLARGCPKLHHRTVLHEREIKTTAEAADKLLSERLS
jgi:FkbH-like protein